MKSFGVFLVLSLLYTVNAKTLPAITRISQEQIRNVGEPVEFECSVSNLQNYSVAWTTKNHLIISAGAYVVIHDPRFSIRANETSSTMRIRDIRESDAGDYQCEIIIDANKKIIRAVPLRVRTRPLIANNSTFSLIVRESADVKLECYAEGFPVPTISWRREHNARLPNGEYIYRGNVLHIPEARKEFHGVYYCIAENGFGSEAIREIPLGILFAPIVEIPRQRVGQSLGYDADLVCRVKSFPRSIVLWHKNKELLSTNEKYTISNFEISEGNMDSILRIKAIKKSQYGEYTCVMQNGFGTAAEGSIELFETNTPICPPACDSTHTNGTGIASNSSRVQIDGLVVQNITDFTELP